MSTTAHTLDHSTLENLAAAGAVRGACAVGQAGGWEVVIEYGNTQRALSAKRGEIRRFKKFETLASYLHKMGIDQFRTDVRHFDPAAKVPGKRSDSSERLREAHAAVAYRKWLEEEVTATKAGLAAGTVKRIEPKDWDKIRAAKLKKLEKLKSEA